MYDACPSIDCVRKIVNEKMTKNNEAIPSEKGLAIFDDALKHMLRIWRTINSKRGSVLLVGVGGYEKPSLTKLSSCILNRSSSRLHWLRITMKTTWKIT